MSTSIRTPILRYFLLFYGLLSLHLHPITSTNRKSGYLRLAYNIGLFVLFNWVLVQQNQSMKRSLLGAASDKGKPPP